MRCISCQYDLSKLTEHRCPECGRAFHPSNENTFETIAQFRRSMIICVAVVIGFGLYGAFMAWHFLVSPLVH